MSIAYLLRPMTEGGGRKSTIPFRYYFPSVYILVLVLRLLRYNKIHLPRRVVRSKCFEAFDARKSQFNGGTEAKL